jgi:phosphohistidine phosphatase
MTAILVHHADAVGPHVDPQRPLSTIGQQQANQLAEAIALRGISPRAIWHSGKLRSRQTAETMLRICSPFADFRMVRGLRSEDPVEWMRADLLAEDRDVLLVGHMPHIARLARALVPDSAEFPLHGVIAFEREGLAWKEIWRLTTSN